MKNVIPLIIALVLGTIVAFAIFNGARNSKHQELRTIKVAVAREDIPMGTEIRPKDHVIFVDMSVAVADKSFINLDEFINDPNEMLNVRTRIDIEKGAPIKRSDLTGMQRLEEKISSGNWAVPLSFDDERLVRFIRPGMEIAILGSFTVTKTLTSMEVGGATQSIQQKGTMVVLPKVKVMSIGYGEETATGGMSGGGVLILDLPPDMAATLVAAQREMELYPVIRKLGDSRNDDRTKVGMVTEDTFNSMSKGLHPIKVPDKMP